MKLGEPASQELFDRGAAHFDRGEWYAAHEVFEDLWRELDGVERLFVQALIQVAVALLHFSRGNNAGAWTLSRAALAKCALLPARFGGVDIEMLVERFNESLKPLTAAVLAGTRDAAHPALPLLVALPRD